MVQTPHKLEADRLSTFCHDLRQYVVTGLLMSAVAEDGDPGSDADRRLATIHTLFGQLDLLLAAEVGDAGPRRERIDLPELVAECIQILRFRDVEIETRIAQKATAFGDPVLLSRAVRNVLDNAANASGEHGTIRVRVTVAGHDSVIEVTNDGLTFGSGPRGSGQGMSVVAMAVDACGGRLEILSGPASGTRIRMVLPRDGVHS